MGLYFEDAHSRRRHGATKLAVQPVTGRQKSAAHAPSHGKKIEALVRRSLGSLERSAPGSEAPAFGRRPSR